MAKAAQPYSPLPVVSCIRGRHVLEARATCCVCGVHTGVKWQLRGVGEPLCNADFAALAKVVAMAADAARS